jgi:hypothetical protein
MSGCCPQPELQDIRLVARNSLDAAPVSLEGILTALETHADGELFPVDVPVVALARQV